MNKIERVITKNKDTYLKDIHEIEQITTKKDIFRERYTRHFSSNIFNHIPDQISTDF